MAPKEKPHTPDESSSPVLTLDDVVAVVVAVPPQSDELLAYFRTKGLDCRLQRRQGVRGQDVIDFGNPNPAEERLIRKLFKEWESRTQ
jgi:hypothetical protein